MNRTTKQLASIGFAFLLIASVFSVVQVGAAQSASTYSITQGEQCYTVSPMQGSEDVASFYDYRNPEKTPNATGRAYYSSFGTQGLQENQVSQMFLYEHDGQVSLVFVHDLLDTDEQNGEFGSTISMDVAGLPSGSWAVEDDDYQGQDDTWNKGASTAQIDWVWAQHRTDGGAYTGLQNLDASAVTIDARFNDNADRWDSRWGGGNNVIDAWKFVRADGSKVTLDMSQNVSITAGACESDTTPTPTEEPTPTTTTEEQTTTTEEQTTTTEETTQKTTQAPSDTDEAPQADLTWDHHNERNNQIGLSAHGSTDDNGIVRYEWDYDSDGEVDAVTRPGDEVVTQKFPKYHATGTYTATVTVYDESGQSDSASVTFDIEDDDGPTINMDKFDAPSDVAVGQTFDATIGGVYDPLDVKSIAWTFDGKAPSDGSTTKRANYNDRTYSSTATHAFTQKGTYKVLITAEDGEGNVATKSAWITVHEKGWTPADGGSDDGKKTAKNQKKQSDDSWVDVHRKAHEDKQTTEQKHETEQETEDAETTTETSTPTPEPTFDSSMVEILDLQTSDETVTAGQKFTVTATVSNTNEVAGTMTIRLTDGDHEIATRDVSLDAKETKTVKVSHTFQSAGTYTITVDGLSKTIDVEPAQTTTDEKALQQETPTMQQETTNDSGQPGFGIAAALVALVAAALVAIRRD